MFECSGDDLKALCHAETPPSILARLKGFDVDLCFWFLRSLLWNSTGHREMQPGQVESCLIFQTVLKEEGFNILGKKVVQPYYPITIYYCLSSPFLFASIILITTTSQFDIYILFSDFKLSSTLSSFSYTGCLPSPFSIKSTSHLSCPFAPLTLPLLICSLNLFSQLFPAQPCFKSQHLPSVTAELKSNHNFKE